MKLNKQDKEIIIKRIMDDVPSVNYTDQVHKLVRDHFKAQIPPAIKKILADPKLAQHVEKSQVWIEGFSNSYVDGGFTVGSYAYPSDEVKEEIAEIKKLDTAQSGERKSIKQKLESAFAGLNTRKQALECFPEFEKYLPDADAGIRNLPITTDVIPALVAANWPKGKKPTAKLAKT